MAASDETRWWCYLLRPTRPDILQTGPTPAEAELMGAHWAYTTPPPSSSPASLGLPAASSPPSCIPSS